MDEQRTTEKCRTPKGLPMGEVQAVVVYQKRIRPIGLPSLFRANQPTEYEVYASSVGEVLWSMLSPVEGGRTKAIG